MADTIFETLSLGFLFLLSLVFFLAITEVGFWIGRWGKNRKDTLETGPTGVITGSILGLVSFLLAFSFGIAASNYSERRGVVLDEANAIGTAYLRADFLPDGDAEVVRSLLREYTAIRVAVTERQIPVFEYFLTIRESERIHGLLWERVARVAKEMPSPTQSLVVTAVNDVIDIHSKRVAVGLRHAIPATIWVALYLVSALALASTGYRFGASFGKRSELLPAMVIAFACVVSLIADLDNPRHGFLLNDQAPMKDLLQGMQRPSG
jgi:hypothetical protein